MKSRDVQSTSGGSAFLNLLPAKKIVKYRPGEVIFSQGAPCLEVDYIEEDLIDRVFNSSEKRLARTLLLLNEHGKRTHSPLILERISQDTLADMVGTTRSRVNFFMNKFRKLGFIRYNGGLKIYNSLQSLLQD